MSELNATIKVVFRKIKSANIFHSSICEVASISEKAGYELDEGSGFSSVKFSEYDLSHIEISSIKQDKKSIQFHLWGGVGSASEVLHQLYKGIDGSLVKTFISSAYNDQVGYNYYPCYHDTIYYDYGEEQNPDIDNKLMKAEENGNQFEVLEKLVKAKKLLNAEMALNDCINEYVKNGVFHTRYLNVKGIETGRNSDGDTLLTAMIKAGHERQAIWLLDVPMCIDYGVSDNEGNTPYELAKIHGMSELISEFERNKVYRPNVNLESPESFTIGDEFPLIELASKCKIHGLHMYEYGYVSISHHEIMYPGEHQILIFDYWDSNNKKCYEIRFYNKRQPNAFYYKKGLTIDQLLQCVDDYGSQRI
ncbi:hypothetical protein HF888_09575 [Bermanella marisrubri]|uniref:Ankyrin repeat domain-containing protein n=1 Tax=Bermanella marisrubri TaxID=207949 RepID=Q1N6B5_9GAMM|nr:hypothetical protein [Bermanella marisrubri]EAT13677.1 hypothetical protein RED65_09804 [Oceanobacter sp. RED65] [Bermanella marisrubri]QIZ84457.1 hypothetical protein HF888_09575 [Bermanella marisrubri]